MSDRHAAPSDDALEDALRDLGRALDLDSASAAAQQARISAAVLDASDRSARHVLGPRTQQVARALVAAAAIVLVVLVVVAPAREAVASWLGIGAVRITTSGEPPPSSTSTTAPSHGQEVSSAEVEALARSLPFEVRLVDPSVGGPLRGAEVDASVGVGLIELRYDEFTVVQVGSPPAAAPAVGKQVGLGTSISAVDVEGHDGLWLDGDPHAIAHLDADGEVVHDTLRRAGDVLLWTSGDVTYRVEGLRSLEEALVVAASLG